MLLLALVVALAGLCAGPAVASQTLERNVTNVRLAVNAKGEALVTYTRANGQVRRVLAWGALDAVAPDPNLPQQHFKLDCTGGWGKNRARGYWRPFKNVCRPYSGPGGAALGAYDSDADRAFDAMFDSILGADKACSAGR